MQNYPLVWLIAGCAGVARVLLAADGIDANAASSTGATALYIAAFEGQADVVVELLSHTCGTEGVAAALDACEPPLPRHNLPHPCTPTQCRRHHTHARTHDTCVDLRGLRVASAWPRTPLRV